jgi:hypothetical protein
MPEGKGEPLAWSIPQDDTGKEFITAEKEFLNAVGKTSIQDYNAVINDYLYYCQMAEFEMWDEIDQFGVYLSMLPTIGGNARRQALQAKIGIAVPEWESGVKLSAQAKKQVEEINRLKQQREHADQHPS